MKGTGTAVAAITALAVVVLGLQLRRGVMRDEGYYDE